MKLLTLMLATSCVTQLLARDYSSDFAAGTNCYFRLKAGDCTVEEAVSVLQNSSAETKLAYLFSMDFSFLDEPLRAKLLFSGLSDKDKDSVCSFVSTAHRIDRNKGPGFDSPVENLFAVAACLINDTEAPSVPQVLEPETICGAFNAFVEARTTTARLLSEEAAASLSKASLAEKLSFARSGWYGHTTRTVLERLSEDDSPDVRLAVALNRLTPYEVLERLTKDNDSAVAMSARDLIWHFSVVSPRQLGSYVAPRTYESLPSVVQAKQDRTDAQLYSTTAVQARVYRDCREARADLPRLFGQWLEHPHAVHASVTNALWQVAALRNRGAPLGDVQVFFEDCMIRSLQLPIPTNHTVEQQKSTFMFRASLIQDEVFSMKNRDGFSATFAPKLADLCAHFKARRDAFDKRISAWKAAEPPLDGTPESQRRHEDWDERGNLLRAHRDWAECERRTIHLWLFDYFTDNWTSDGLSNLSPKARYDARIALLRRANVDSGPFQSLSDEAMQCFRRETNARERELAADEKRRAWLWSRAKGSLGSGFPGRIESYEVDPPLKEHLNRFRLMAGRFVRNPVEGAGRELTTDSISNSIPFLLFTPKMSASKAMPVILYFGGTGELGSDLSVQFRQSAVFRTICSDEFQRRHPCYLFAPLCPEGSSSLGPTQHGRGDDLGDLVFDALYALAANAKPTMDLNRLYITGLSWGGHAAFHMPWAYPGRFAAGIPVSAAPTAHMVTTNAPCSFWALYNEGEPHRTAIEERMRKTKEIVEAHGGELRWSTFPDAGHDAWTKAWAEPAVWDWCFSKTADGRPVPGARTQATTAEAISAQTPRLAATRPGTPGHEPERASDGLAATWYEGDGPAKTGDVLESELPEPRSGRLRVELRGTEAERPRCHVETSADGRIWTRVGTISRKTGAFAATLTTPVVRVRIVVDTPAPHPLRVTTLLVEQRP